LLPL
jgi:hypothetical protein